MDKREARYLRKLQKNREAADTMTIAGIVSRPTYNQIIAGVKAAGICNLKMVTSKSYAKARGLLRIKKRPSPWSGKAECARRRNRAW